jgi:serine/threonine-protein kinase RsbW
MSNSATLTLQNRLDQIERISRDLEAFGKRNGLPPRLVSDVSLALDEVLTNIVSYAYDDAAAHQIVVRLAVSEDRLVVEVEDDGKPFDPLSVEEPDLAMAAEDRPVGGLGLSLVRRLMSELGYERRGDRNVLVLTRTIAETGGAAARSALNLIIERRNRVVVLYAVGRIDSASAAVFERDLLGRVAAGERRIVVDCSRLEYINSAGLRVLLVAAKRLKADSGALAVAAAKGQIRSVLEMVGFDAIFPVCSTVEAAKKTLTTG